MLQWDQVWSGGRCQIFLALGPLFPPGSGYPVFWRALFFPAPVALLSFSLESDVDIDEHSISGDGTDGDVTDVDIDEFNVSFSITDVNIDEHSISCDGIIGDVTDIDEHSISCDGINGDFTDVDIN